MMSKEYRLTKNMYMKYCLLSGLGNSLFLLIAYLGSMDFRFNPSDSFIHVLIWVIIAHTILAFEVHEVLKKDGYLEGFIPFKVIHKCKVCDDDSRITTVSPIVLHNGEYFEELLDFFRLVIVSVTVMLTTNNMTVGITLIVLITVFKCFITREIVFRLRGGK